MAPKQSPLDRWTRRTMIASAIFAALVVTRNAWLAYRYYQQIAAIRCDAPVFDFATAFSGDVIEHSFHVINVGRTPLKITTVRAECGCTTLKADLTGRTILPQGEFDVPVTLRLTSAEKGILEKKVSLAFEGESSPMLNLRIRGSVESRWRSSPDVLIFHDMGPDETATRVFTVAQNEKAPLANINNVSTSRWLTAVFERDPSKADGRTWTFTVRTTPPLAIGRWEGVVLIQTSDSDSGISIPVKLIVSNPAERVKTRKSPESSAKIGSTKQ
jgi:hypothetical protein